MKEPKKTGKRKRARSFERVAVSVGGEVIELRRTHSIDYWQTEIFSLELKFERTAVVSVFGTYYKESEMERDFERIKNEPERYEILTTE